MRSWRHAAMKIELKLGKIDLRGWRATVTLLGVGLVGAAVLSELRRPREQRTWHGRVIGVVPYDLRPPTVDRLRRSVWDPENPRVFTARTFGVGWNVNVASLARAGERIAGRRAVDPSRDEDIEAVIHQALKKDPMADYQDVLAAWHVRRGVEIDEAEADRVAEVYQRLLGPDRSVTERGQSPTSTSFGAA